MPAWEQQEGRRHLESSETRAGSGVAEDPVSGLNTLLTEARSAKIAAERRAGGLEEELTREKAARIWAEEARDDAKRMLEDAVRSQERAGKLTLESAGTGEDRGL